LLKLYGYLIVHLAILTEFILIFLFNSILFIKTLFSYKFNLQMALAGFEVIRLRYEGIALKLFQKYGENQES
jgi:hypothetical protein